MAHNSVILTTYHTSVCVCGRNIWQHVCNVDKHFNGISAKAAAGWAVKEMVTRCVCQPAKYTYIIPGVQHEHTQTCIKNMNVYIANVPKMRLQPGQKKYILFISILYFLPSKLMPAEFLYLPYLHLFFTYSALYAICILFLSGEIFRGDCYVSHA